MSDDQPAALHLELVWSDGAQARRQIEPELFALLEAIRRTGKLTPATAQVALPYRQAWRLIAKWSGIGQPMIVKEQGRGTRLTPVGEHLLWLRERIEARLSPHLESAISEVEQELTGLRAASPPMISVYASHDLVLAELRDMLRSHQGPKLDVQFVGSVDSVVALCKGRCEAAGFHVPEGEFGKQLASAYQPWLKPRAQRLVQFVERCQGLTEYGKTRKTGAAFRMYHVDTRRDCRDRGERRSSGVLAAGSALGRHTGIVMPPRPTAWADAPSCRR